MEVPELWQELMKLMKAERVEVYNRSMDAMVEALETISGLVRDATKHSSCQDCTVERKMESVHEYIARVIKLVEQGQRGES